jgi:hypothetical protein
MPDNMTCFACEQEPTQQCPRCGRPYCDDHGEDVCDACLEPASGLPSVTLYRGSLLALLLGTFLAVWLILQPPGDTVDTAAAPVIVTPTLPAGVQTAPPPTLSITLTPAPGTTGTPTTSQTPGGTPSTTATAPAGTATPAAGTVEYTVQSGDTLFGICSTLSAMDPTECVTRVLELNSISDPSGVAVGETITIPLQ